jgi:hypothetical protein
VVIPHLINAIQVGMLSPPVIIKKNLLPDILIDSNILTKCKLKGFLAMWYNKKPAILIRSLTVTRGMEILEFNHPVVTWFNGQ